MSQSSQESPNSSQEWKSSQETELESPESSREFDEETFLATLTIQDGQPTLAPRERRTLRDELCIQCLEEMLGRRDITCLRDSDCPKCRHCQSLGRECHRLPAQFNHEIYEVRDAAPEKRPDIARATLMKVWPFWLEARKKQAKGTKQ